MIKETAGKALVGESHLLWKPLAVNGSAYLLQIYTYPVSYTHLTPLDFLRHKRYQTGEPFRCLPADSNRRFRS